MTNTKSKFKPGDRVRVLKDEANCASVKAGDEFIVGDTKEWPDGLAGITTTKDERGYTWAFDDTNIELVEAPPKSPIQTFTTAKVVGGRYGMVEIITGHCRNPNLFQIKAMAFSDVDTTPQHLRAAAELFVELADHLEGV